MLQRISITRPLLLTLSLTAFALLGGCAVNPVSGDQDFVLMTEDQEIQAGKRYHKEILKQYKVLENPALQDYVDNIGQELARQSHRKKLPFYFTVLDSPEVNAFALPGGYIYITRGIMAYLNSEAELAGVLGHEIGHVTARHSVRQQSTSQVTGLLGGILNVATGQDANRGLFSQVGFALSQGYGRDHELEADKLGAEYLARIGYSPDSMIDVVTVLKNQELFERERAKTEGRAAQTYHGLFASHPSNDKRLRKVIKAAKKFQTGQDRDIGRDTYLRKIEDVLFGQNSDDGVVRGNKFYHASLDASLTGPEDWFIENASDRLIFVAPKQDALIQVTLKPRGESESPQEFLEQHLKRRELQDTRTLSANSMSGYSAVATVDKTPFGKRKVRYSVWLRNEFAWIFAATTKEHVDFELLDPKISKTVSSLKPLNSAERKLAEPVKLKLVRAKSSTTYKKLAQDSPLPSYAESRLRLINGQYPDGEPQAGELIKIVQ
ncbi:MAG: M48 family metalloprotease [Pseudomonadota bacterium]